MVSQLASLFAVAIINLAAWTIGQAALRRYGPRDMDRLATLVWSLMLGLLAGGLLLTVAGLCGGIYRPAIGVGTLALCCWGLGTLGRPRASTAASPGAPAEPAADGAPAISPADETTVSGGPLPPALPLARIFGLWTTLALAGALLGALAPPTAGDALCYHLELPKKFIAEHAITFDVHDDNCTYPLLTEMWYLWALVLDGEVAAQLLHWEMGLALALAAVLLARPVLGSAWAWIAGAIVLLVPGVNNQMTAPLNDVALAVWATLALGAWFRALAEDNRRWYVLAGVALGGALSTKYTALLLVAAVAPVWLLLIYRRRPQRKSLLAGVALVSVAAVLVGGVWYVRAAWHRGNPVFPFFAEVASAADDASARPTTTLPAAKAPLGHGPAGLILSPWAVTMQPERHGGRGHQLGLLFLATLPGLLLVRRLNGLRLPLIVAACYWLAWFGLRQNVRFLLPIVPLLALGVVWVLIELRRFPAGPRGVAGLAVTALLCAAAFLPLYRCRHEAKVALGLESRGQYLLKHEPTFALAQDVNAVLRPDAHLLSQELRNYYFRRRVTRESIYRRNTHYDRQLAGPGQLSATLRAAGFSHLVLAETVSGGGITYDDTLSRLADAELQSFPETLLPLGRYEFRDPDGTLRRYRLVALR